MSTEARDYKCDICSGPLGQQRWRGYPPICSKCEMEIIHDTPGLSGPYLDSYNRLRDLRNTLADIFRHLESEGDELVEGEPIVEAIEQIQDLAETFRDSVVKPADAFIEED
ncbi:MAG: hypothetical protein NVSMB52_02990 [Chloroflexota bacterium]